MILFLSFSSLSLLALLKFSVPQNTAIVAESVAVITPTKAMELLLAILEITLPAIIGMTIVMEGPSINNKEVVLSASFSGGLSISNTFFFIGNTVLGER